MAHCLSTRTHSLWCLVRAFVYKYVCPQCGAVYVGSTTRTLHTRASEHLGVSPRTGMHLSQPSQSSIRSHSEQSCHCAPNINSFSIIDNANNPSYLRIKESIHIKLLKPPLNETISAHPLYILNWISNVTYNIFILVFIFSIRN